MAFVRQLASLVLMALGCFGAVWAQHPDPIVVTQAWARATVQGQKASGAFMKLQSPKGMRLVRLQTSVAGVAELHEMKMEGGVMKMGAVAGLDLPAGQVVELKPGGYHVMLMDLKHPLSAGASVPLTLVMQDASGAEVQQQITVPVLTKAPDAGTPSVAPSHKH